MATTADRSSWTSAPLPLSEGPFPPCFRPGPRPLARAGKAATALPSGDGRTLNAAITLTRLTASTPLGGLRGPRHRRPPGTRRGAVENAWRWRGDPPCLYYGGLFPAPRINTLLPNE